MRGTKTACPVCSVGLDEPSSHAASADRVNFSCPRCGRYQLSGVLDAGLEHEIGESRRKAAVLSYAIRRMQSAGDAPLLVGDTVNRILNDDHLPSPAEQFDLLLLWLGDHLESIGETVFLEPMRHLAILGALHNEDLFQLVRELVDRGLVRADASEQYVEVSLTLAGWDEVRKLERGSTTTRKAFMAIQFGDEELNGAFVECFKPAAAHAGFELVRVDDEPRAGLIDDNIRLGILTSRFVVADLTFNNRGVYWEAGFAEGLGKPVIYTCKRTFFEKKAPHEEDGGVHFDTRNRLTVLWDSDDLEAAVEGLKTVIRTTLPDEAKLED